MYHSVTSMHPLCTSVLSFSRLSFCCSLSLPSFLVSLRLPVSAKFSKRSFSDRLCVFFSCFTFLWFCCLNNLIMFEVNIPPFIPSHGRQISRCHSIWRTLFKLTRFIFLPLLPCLIHHEECIKQIDSTATTLHPSRSNCLSPKHALCLLSFRQCSFVCLAVDICQYIRTIVC